MTSEISSTLTPPSWSKVGSPDKGTQDMLSAIEKIEVIPDQLKKSAHDWAAKELTSQLKVLRVTLLANPTSAHALNDLAKGIASDVKTLAQNLSPGAATGATPDTTTDTTATESGISATEEDSIQGVITLDGAGNETISYMEKQSVAITSQSAAVTSSDNASDTDVDLIGEAQSAMSDIKKALEELEKHGHKHGISQSLNAAENAIHAAISSLLDETSNSVSPPSLSIRA
jgi:hypothetical protein